MHISYMVIKSTSSTTIFNSIYTTHWRFEPKKCSQFPLVSLPWLGPSAPKHRAESTADTTGSLSFGQMCKHTQEVKITLKCTGRDFLSRNASKSINLQLHQAGLRVLCTVTGTGSLKVRQHRPDIKFNIKAKKTPVNLKLRHIWKCCSYYSNQQSLASLLSKPHAISQYLMFLIISNNHYPSKFSTPFTETFDIQKEKTYPSPGTLSLRETHFCLTSQNIFDSDINMHISI